MKTILNRIISYVGSFLGRKVKYLGHVIKNIFSEGIISGLFTVSVLLCLSFLCSILILFSVVKVSNSLINKSKQEIAEQIAKDRETKKQQEMVQLIQKNYKAPHKLRKMFVKDVEFTTKTPGKASFDGWVFLLAGSAKGNYTEGTSKTEMITQVRFAYETEDNIYDIITLPMEKVRFKIVEKIKIPTVSFFINGDIIGNIENLRKFQHISIDNTLDYVIVTIQEKDWPQDINLPMNRGF